MKEELLRTRTTVMVLELLEGLFAWMWLVVGVSTLWFLVLAVAGGGPWSSVIWASAVSAICKWLSVGLRENKIRIRLQHEDQQAAEPTDPAATPTASPPAVDSTSDEARADALVQAYAKLLESGAGLVLKPESSLPASKAEIKDALLTVATYHHDNGTMMEEGESVFRNAYSFLANFVDDERAANSAVMFTAAAAWKNSPTRSLDELRAAAKAIASATTDEEADPGHLIEPVALAAEFDERFLEMRLNSG